MPRTNLTEDDEGKSVVNFDGDEIGMVSRVENGTARVNPNPDLTDSIRSKLGWNKSNQNDYMLENKRISAVTDDEIRLKDQ